MMVNTYISTTIDISNNDPYNLMMEKIDFLISYLGISRREGKNE